jgi:hypothetical protein
MYALASGATQIAKRLGIGKLLSIEHLMIQPLFIHVINDLTPIRL